MTPLLLMFFTATSVYCQAINETEHINAFVNMHNRLRRSVYPPAAGLNYVSWSPELANAAHEAACGYPTTPFTRHATRGRNYFRDTQQIPRNVGSDSAIRMIETAVMKWFTEKGVYNYENNTCTYTVTKEICDAFRLIISPTLSEIGCAVKEDCSTTKYRQYLCLYNTLVTDSSTPIYKSGVPGSGCVGTSKVNESTGLSLQGLCLMTVANVLSVNRTLSGGVSKTKCGLTCKNCATDQVKSVVECNCRNCPYGYSGADCSIKGNSATALACGTCQQQGTPCLHNGEDKSADGKCICACGPTRAGPYCNVLKDIYDNLVYIELRSSISGDTLPLDPILYDNITRVVTSAVRIAINAFCVSTNTSIVAKCCRKTKPKAAPTHPFLSNSSKVTFHDNGGAPNGSLWVAFFVLLSAINNLCEPAFREDKVPLEVVVESLKAPNFTTAMTNELSNVHCRNSSCPFELVANSVSIYKVIADDQYGIKTPSITTTNKPQTDGNEDTTTAIGPSITTAAGPSTATTVAILVLLLVLMLVVLAAAKIMRSHLMRSD